MKIHRARQVVPALAASLSALLAGCGGGVSPSVSSLQATPVAYGRTTTLTVNGSNLDTSLTASIGPGCPTMTRQSSNATTQTYSCRIGVIGDLRVRVRNAEGGELATLRLNVDAPRVTFSAAQGNETGIVVVELDPVAAPKSVDNFLAYVNASSGCFYRNTTFHRVIATRLVQGGGFTASLTVQPGIGSPIVLESNNGLKNLRGTIAMARTEVPNSATSQFYINTVDNPSFDYVSESNPGYAVFGTVISGMDRIDVLQNVPVTTKTVNINDKPVKFDDVPVDPVVITTCSQTRADVRALVEPLSLAWPLAKRDVLARYRGSAAGLAWALLAPLAMVAIYALVFQGVFGARWTGAARADGAGGLDYAARLFAGLMAFTALADVATRATRLMQDNANLVKRVVFPLELLCVALVMQVAVHSLLQTGVLAALLLISGHGASVSWLWLLLAWPWLWLLQLALAIGLAALGPYLRDLQHIVPLVMSGMLFLSPVFYPTAAAPQALRWLLGINPLSMPIELVRTAWFGDAFDWASAALPFAGTFLALFIAHRLFVRLRPGFADLV